MVLFGLELIKASMNVVEYCGPIIIFPKVTPPSTFFNINFFKINFLNQEKKNTSAPKNFPLFLEPIPQTK